MSDREAQEAADRIVAKFERQHYLRLLAEAEVERLRLLLRRVKGTERSTSHDDVLVRFSNQDWDEIREWALAE